MPIDTTVSNLYMPEDRPLADSIRFLLEKERGLSPDRVKQILETLADYDVTTYGQLVEHVQGYSIACLPGIDDELKKLYQLRNYVEQQGIELPPEIRVGEELTYVEAIYAGIIRAELENKRLLVEKYQEAQEEIVRLKQQQPDKQLEKAAIDGREIAKSM